MLSPQGEQTGTVFVSFRLSIIGDLLHSMSLDGDRFELRDSKGVTHLASRMVTSMLPPFARNGWRVDVTVASMGDASSLHGGVLLQTPLLGA